MPRLSLGTQLDPRLLKAMNGETIGLPDPARFTHLQFRRFVGCPICNLHLQSFIRQYPRLQQHRIQEVAIFHSSEKAMQQYNATAPFPLIADPSKTLYRAFGVDASFRSLLHPKAWPALLKGVVNVGVGLPGWGESLFGLPADFLLDSHNRVVALKYGTHADDQWSVDELIGLVSRLESHAENSR